MVDMVITSILPDPFHLLSPCFISAVTFPAQKMPVKAFFLDKRKSMWLVSIKGEVLPINTGPNGLSAVKSLCINALNEYFEQEHTEVCY